MKLKNEDRTCGWKWVKKMYHVDDFENKLGPQLLLKVAKSHTYFTENQSVTSQNWCLRLTLGESFDLINSISKMF